MRLRGIEFGKLFCAPGARGFFGEGYPFHHYWKYLGMTWEGTTFVAKTTTLLPREGSMPLGKDGITPTQFPPRCIVTKPISGHILNAVGLSGPGAKALFEDGRWQQRTDPFMLSFMSVAGSKEERLKELQEYVELGKHYLPHFRAPVALQLNFACPNAGLHLEELCEEVSEALDIAAELNVPLVPNFNPLVPEELLVETALHSACDALWIANTIPWGTPGINWVDLFGSNESPLIKRGLPAPGGLSGPACLPFVLERLREAKEDGINIPIVAGNGIQSVADARRIRKAGAAGIAVGVVGIVRPWRMRSIAKYVNEESYLD